MTTNNDDRDDKSAGSDDGLVCISSHYLGVLFATTGERIDFDDHGAFVIVLSEDVKQLHRLALAFAQEFAIDKDEVV